MISDKLKQELKDKGQFPYGKRDRAYQSIDGEPGIRDMEHRYDIINFPKSFDGETVIDFSTDYEKKIYEEEVLKELLV